MSHYQLSSDNIRKNLLRITNISPRYSGSPGIKKLYELILSELRKEKVSIQKDEFLRDTPRGQILFRNIIAEIQGEGDQFVLIACHYDTKFLASVPEFMGANDGASGVALLFELIRVYLYADIKPRFSMRFAFFDGEECCEVYDEQDGLYGSKHYCKRLTYEDEGKSCIAMILVDMIGDKNLSLTIPLNVTEELVEVCQKAAMSIGCSELVGRFKGNLIDDHSPFFEAEIPVINLIDFHYGPGNAFWHTANDTLENVSEESIKRVGEIVIEMVKILNSQFTKGLSFK